MITILLETPETLTKHEKQQKMMEKKKTKHFYELINASLTIVSRQKPYADCSRDENQSKDKNKTHTSPKQYISSLLTTNNKDKIENSFAFENF